MIPQTFPQSFTDPACYPWSFVDIACPCCGHSVLDFRLYYALRALYAATLKGFRITSLARCHAHNHHVGGTPESRHLYGLAADIAPTKGDLHALAHTALCIRPFRSGGLGYNPINGIIHLDIRIVPYRWVTDTNGRHPVGNLWPDLTPEGYETQCSPLETMPYQEPPLPPS